MSKIKQLREAVERDSLTDIKKVLNSLNNIRTAYSYYYKEIRGKVSLANQKAIYTHYVEPLIVPRVEEYKESIKSVITIKEADLRELLDNKDHNDKYKLIYVLLLTGRRLSEILDSPKVDIRDNKLYVGISKKSGRPPLPVHILNNAETPAAIKKMIEELAGRIPYKSAPTLIRRVLHKYRLSAHDLRGVYIELISRFYNPEKRNKSGLVLKYLNHDSFQKSYDHINYVGNNPFKTKGEGLATLKVGELKALAKELGLNGYSRLKRADLIALLSR